MVPDDEDEQLTRRRMLAANAKRWWEIACGERDDVRLEVLNPSVGMLDTMLVTHTSPVEDHPAAVQALEAFSTFDNLTVRNRLVQTTTSGSLLLRWHLLAFDEHKAVTHTGIASTCYMSPTVDDKGPSPDGAHFPTMVVWAHVDTPDVWTVNTGTFDEVVVVDHQLAWLRMVDTLHRLTVTYLCERVEPGCR